MPIPKPKKNENHDDFVSRCMSDDVMMGDYKDEKQRYAVCQTQWDDSRKVEIPDACERRIFSPEDVELRISEDAKPKISGYAAKYNSFTDLGFFREQIKAGAFNEAIASTKTDVRCLKNHDPNLILGRTKNGTLRMTSNSVGLRFENDMPDTNTGKDTLEEIRTGLISGCSFAFTVSEDDWKYYDDKPAERTIVKIKELFDVGPVTYPAYPDTTVAARSLETFKANMNTEKNTTNINNDLVIKNPDIVIETKKAEKSPEEVKREKDEDFEKRFSIQSKYRECLRIIARNKPA